MISIARFPIVPRTSFHSVSLPFRARFVSMFTTIPSTGCGWWTPRHAPTASSMSHSTVCDGRHVRHVHAVSTRLLSFHPHLDGLAVESSEGSTVLVLPPATASPTSPTPAFDGRRRSKRIECRSPGGTHRTSADPRDHPAEPPKPTGAKGNHREEGCLATCRGETKRNRVRTECEGGRGTRRAEDASAVHLDFGFGNRKIRRWKWDSRRASTSRRDPSRDPLESHRTRWVTTHNRKPRNRGDHHHVHNRDRASVQTQPGARFIHTHTHSLLVRGMKNSSNWGLAERTVASEWAG